MNACLFIFTNDFTNDWTFHIDRSPEPPAAQPAEFEFDEVKKIVICY